MTEVARRWWPVAAILIATFAIRGFSIGNPNLETDEQLYLVIGDRLLHGHLPYVELWDRKPIGLFLFYAGVRALGGSGIVQYQLIAAACAGLTACLIWILARRGSGRTGALVAAIAYVLWLNPLHGGGGQSPVIYNPLIACAAWAAFRANDCPDERRVRKLALVAMAASGLAIQFKYTPFVEGAAFGLHFLLRLRRAGSSHSRLAATAVAMVVVALLPSIAAIAFYWASGHLDAYVQANFTSVFHRNPFPHQTRVAQRMLVLVIGGPLLVLAPFALQRRWTDCTAGGRDDAALAVSWFAAALVGFGMLGAFYDFYFITVLPPLLVLVAPLLRAGRVGFGLSCFLVYWPLLCAPPMPGVTTRSRAQMSALASAVRPYVGPSRCLYVYDGPTILYLLTDACAPSRFIYPDHLTNPIEAPALGVDPVAEERRLLAKKPGGIVTAGTSLVPRVNAATQKVLKAVLARDYVLVARVQADRIYDVYALRGLHSGPGLRLPSINPV